METQGTASARALINVSGSNQVSRPSYNSSSSNGFFVLDGQLYDPNGYPFRIRGIDRCHYDSTSWADGASGAQSGANTVRFFQYNIGDTGSYYTASQFYGVASTQSVANGILPVITAANVANSSAGTSGDQSTTDLAAVVSWWVENEPAWEPIMGQVAFNIANEWGPGASTTWEYAYQAVESAIGNISGTTITLTSTAATNPFANTPFAYVSGAGGVANQVVTLSNPGGSVGAWTVQSNATLGGYTGGGTLHGGAVGALRAAGYTAPLVIDSGGYGQDQADLLNYAAAIQASDPLQNCVFSFHAYGGVTNFYSTISNIVSSGSNTTVTLNSNLPYHPFNPAYPANTNNYTSQNAYVLSGVQGMTSINGLQTTNNNNIGGTRGAWTVTLSGTFSGSYVSGTGAITAESNYQYVLQRLAALEIAECGRWGPGVRPGKRERQPHHRRHRPLPHQRQRAAGDHRCRGQPAPVGLLGVGRQQRGGRSHRVHRLVRVDAVGTGRLLPEHALGSHGGRNGCGVEPPLWPGRSGKPRQRFTRSTRPHRFDGCLTPGPAPAAVEFRAQHLLHHKFLGEVDGRDTQAPTRAEVEWVGSSSWRKIASFTLGRFFYASRPANRVARDRWLVLNWLLQGLVTVGLAFTVGWKGDPLPARERSGGLRASPVGRPKAIGAFSGPEGSTDRLLLRPPQPGGIQRGSPCGTPRLPLGALESTAAAPKARGRSLRRTVLVSFLGPVALPPLRRFTLPGRPLLRLRHSAVGARPPAHTRSMEGLEERAARAPFPLAPQGADLCGEALSRHDGHPVANSGHDGRLPGIELLGEMGLQVGVAIAPQGERWDVARQSFDHLVVSVEKLQPGDGPKLAEGGLLGHVVEREVPGESINLPPIELRVLLGELAPKDPALPLPQELHVLRGDGPTDGPALTEQARQGKPAEVRECDGVGIHDAVDAVRVSRRPRHAHDSTDVMDHQGDGFGDLQRIEDLGDEHHLRVHGVLIAVG